MGKSTVGKIFALASALILAAFLSGCQGLQAGNGGGNNPPPPPPPAANLQSINHIVFMLQENRSFDSYFGKLPDYWQANGFPSQQFEGLPATASNPSFDGLSTINSFHLKTMCFSDLSPSWNESHVDWNRQSPTDPTPTLDGFAFNAAKFARNNGDHDIEGFRAMGYYTGDDLNYYYFMASNFAISDMWFSPIMSRTPPNRQYLLAGTSAGHVYASGPLTNKTIFQALEEAGITWKVYESDANSSYLRGFQPFADQHPSNFVTADTFATDVANGTLPAVAMIDSGYRSGRDEHPNNNVQTGAAYAASFINALMASPSWKDSVFILTFDEGGGVYDHVPPQPMPPPDNIGPIDLNPGDICSSGGSNCSFNFTGYRVPLIVISPFSKKNYVSHTVADFTAILKFIQTRFNLNPLTARDAAQMDMTEFFAFPDMPWETPPTPPAQLTTGICDFDQLQ
jgi:phospholipase C